MIHPSVPGSLLLLISIFSCKTLSTQDPPSQLFMQVPSEPRSNPLLATAENEKNWSGIARIVSNQSCTAAFIAMESQLESPAYVITAGHCVMNLTDTTSSFMVYENALAPSNPNLINFRFFREKQERLEEQLSVEKKQSQFHIGRVTYATMRGQDLAILEITAEDSFPGIYRLMNRADQEPEDAALPFPKPVTVQMLKNIGIKPLRIADEIPEFGERIRIISAPVSNEEQSLDGYLQEHFCQHEGLASVAEHVWLWYNLARNNCEDIFPGSSGAPILNARNELFAIANTSSLNALSMDCYIGQPCEITDQGFQVAKNRSYGTVITWLRRCFDARGYLIPSLPACKLTSGHALHVKSQTRTPINPLKMGAADRFWAMEIEERSADRNGVRFKVGLAHKNDCRRAEGYSEVLPSHALGLRNLPLPTASGLYVLCLMSEADFVRKSWEKAIAVLANIDATPPALPAQLISDPVTQQPFMSVRKSCKNLPAQATLELRKKCAVAVVSFELHPPELVEFHFGWIGLNDKDCLHLRGEDAGLHASIPVNSLPAQLCVWGVDGAGNRAEKASIYAIRSATRREIIEATDVMADWSRLGSAPHTSLN